MEQRCINIDWLELYCLEEANNFPHDSSYFERSGYQVMQREYGTRQYNQMFVVCDSEGKGFCEIRRDPVSGEMAKRNRGIFSPYSCHIRLTNRYCYHPQCVDLLSDFLNKHGYQVQRIFRLDLCLDFERFDDNTDPDKFLKRYLDGKFTKVNQGNISAHGSDRWEGRKWNSISWGAPKSMVATKMYNKTLELAKVKDKPYIRYAWFCAGLVSNYDTLTKKSKDGEVYKPNIWRLEFSIRSSAKGWLVIENNEGKNTITEQVLHNLDAYDTKEKQLLAFAMLARHYFHFKYYQEGIRKDLCKDRTLFDFKAGNTTYKLDRLATDKPKDKSLQALRNRIEHYRYTHFDTIIREACDILLKQLQSESTREMLVTYDRTEAELLQQLIARRMKHPEEDYTDSVEVVKALMDLDKTLFVE